MTITRFDGPFVWRSDELWQRPATQHRLNAAENRALRQALIAAKATGLPRAATERNHFPCPILGDTFQAATQELEHGAGVFRLRGLDLDGLDMADMELLFWGIARHFGTPVSQSAKGETLFHVEDRGFGMDHAKARGPNTANALSFHTDRCDVIAFCCVRQAQSGGENLLASSATLHNEILASRPDLLACLYQPFTWQRHNVDTGNDLPYCKLPIFAPWQGRFMANIMRVLIQRGHQLPDMAPLTPLQQEALDFLEQTARRPEIHTQFRQERGDLLFVNNLVVFHSRHGFEDPPDAHARRLLLRMWLATPTSRELDPVYAALYGTHQGSVVRGGIHPPKA